MSEKLLGIILALYPKKWRDRYADEFLAMLELCELSLSDYLDMTLSAIEYRLLDTKGYLMKDLLNRVTGLIALIAALGILSTLFISDEGTAEFLLFISLMMSILLIPAIHRITYIHYPKASRAVMAVGVGAVTLLMVVLILNVVVVIDLETLMMTLSASSIVLLGVWMILVNVLMLKSKVLQPALAYIGVIVGISWLFVMGVTMYNTLSGSDIYMIQPISTIYNFAILGLIFGYLLWSVSVGLVFLTGQASRKLQPHFA